MTLSPGSRLGPYEILNALGAGGMGEVYRARDSRLGREVAIKVLPAERLADEGRRRRFVQEARAASALNHPHIVTIHEIESAEGRDFLVMELVAGKSLDALIPRQGMRLSEVLRIAIPVADALAAAHARGIVHRDLKPANVAIGADGAVKVLDFGLAKLVDNEASADDETSTRATDQGMSAPGAVVGTIAYMSPEQAAGGKVDARSDIFSFGALLYEMSTGTRPFAGASSADTLSAVLRAQPKPPTEIVPALPRELECLILRCLRKEPGRRHQTMLDVKIELQDIKEESDSGHAAAAAPVDRSRRRTWLAAAALVAAAVVIVAVWMYSSRSVPALAPVRVVTETSLRGGEIQPSFHPDGDQLAFSWNGGSDKNNDLYVKFVGSPEVRQLTSGPELDIFPAWSPDGRQIAFSRCPPDVLVSGCFLHVVSAAGGIPRKIFDCSMFRGRWSRDSRWLVTECASPRGDQAGLYLVPADGGTPRRLMRGSPGLSSLRMPDLSPRNDRLAYVDCTAFPACMLKVVEMTNDLQPIGTPKQLRAEVSLASEVAWNPDGASLIYSTQRGPLGFHLWRQPADGSGVPERIEIAGLGATGATLARTRDGRDRLAFFRVRSSVAIHELGAENAPPVLASTLWDFHPAYSPDGSRLAFSSSRSGETVEIWLSARDGSGAHPLTRGPGSEQGSPAWSPDGQRIAFDSNAGGAFNIWVVATDGGAPKQITKGPGDRLAPAWSKDGKWVYFSSGQGGKYNIWRVSAEGDGPATQLTTGGTGIPVVESLDGTEIVYPSSPTSVNSPLVAQPLVGGPAHELIRCIRTRYFALAPAGIYYAECGAGPERKLNFYDPRTRQTRLLGTVRDIFGFDGRIAVSPDGKTILVHKESIDADLMLIENYR